VDGEHYPPVVRATLDEIASGGDEIVAALLAGGREKLPAGGVDAYGDVRVLQGEDPLRVLDGFLTTNPVDAVLDLSDEPVLGYRNRHRFAAVSLYRGVEYRGADFTFSPPPRPRVARKPTIAVIGTGKRTGKTAVCGFTARALVAGGYKPVIVAMGRGGPPEPDVVRGDQIELTPRDLLKLVEDEKHAASDYIEDAILGRVPTVGCRRCGGGLAGGVDHSNVAAGVEIANELPGDLILLEGSGASIPPVHADVTVLVVPASVDPEYLAGYMGPYRLLLADFGVVTMCENPFGSPSQISSLSSLIRSAFRSADHEGSEEEIHLVRTVFRPTPTSSVDGASVFVATTAPEEVGESIRRHLEDDHGCRVTGMSHALADRSRLEQDMQGLAEKATTLLVEIKAAGIDVATRKALDAGLEVVYMDNTPHGIEGEDPADLVTAAADLAVRRFEATP
jgi:cyclic 2,3-diphosphoglycerate synthetase